MIALFSSDSPRNPGWIAGPPAALETVTTATSWGAGVDAAAYPESATSVDASVATKDETTGAKARHGQINLPCGGWFDQIVR